MVAADLGLERVEAVPLATLAEPGRLFDERAGG